MLVRWVLVGLLLGWAGVAQATTMTNVLAQADFVIEENANPTRSEAHMFMDAANGVWFADARAAATASETTNRVTGS